MFIIFTIGLVISLIAALLPLLDRKIWWVRVFDFPKLQLAIFSFFWIIYFFIFAIYTVPISWIGLALLCAILSCQLIRILPYTKLSPKQVDRCKQDSPCTPIKLLTCNVYLFNTDYDACLAMIRQANPDILLLIEVNQTWCSHLAALADEYSYHLQQPQDNTFGMVLYSKFPLQAAKVRFLLDQQVPSIKAQVILNAKLNITLYCMHPAPPAPPVVTGSKKTSAQRDSEFTIITQEIISHDCPTIVMGDLNDVAWSQTTRKFLTESHLQDPRRGRGFYNTFHARYWFLRFPLDHFFHSSHFKLHCLKRLNNIGSDHFPIMIQLCLNEEGDFGG